MPKSIATELVNSLVESMKESTNNVISNAIKTEYRKAEVTAVSGSVASIKFDTNILTNVTILQGVSIVVGDKVNVVITNGNLDRCEINRKL